MMNLMTCVSCDMWRGIGRIWVALRIYGGFDKITQSGRSAKSVFHAQLCPAEGARSRPSIPGEGIHYDFEGGGGFFLGKLSMKTKCVFVCVHDKNVYYQHLDESYLFVRTCAGPNIFGTTTTPPHPKEKL